MYTVTNRIHVKKGMGHKMAPAFAKPGPLQQFDGFAKVEVQVCTTFEEYDEMNVVMYWDNMEGFEAWRSSDAFKQAHKRPDPDQESHSPVIGSQIIISEVVATLEK